jgi:acyl-CoA hydrolase
MNYQELYNAKKANLAECLGQIQSYDIISFAGDCNGAVEILSNLHTIADRVVGVEAIKGHEGYYPFVSAPGMNGHINTGGFFYGRNFMDGHVNRNTSYIVTDLCDYSTFASAHKDYNVFVAATTPMDENGNFQVGLCMMWEKETLEKVRQSPKKKIILEVNPNLPRVNGGIEINIEEVTCFMEVDYAIQEVPSLVADENEVKVAQNVRSLMRDGDCIQLGIGSLPNAIAEQCMDLKDLGLHTEMATTTMGEMIRKGIITGERKNLNKGEHIFTFAGGDRALYDTLGENRACRIVPACYGVNPMIIMQNDNMVSINTCIEMDLTGQVCSESIGPRQYSGSGGGFDYAYGALHSKGGRGIMAFTSVTKKGYSKIKTLLTPGANITVPRNYVDYIVTEYGIAPMRGRSVRERTENLIAVAHPDFRAQLRKEAEELFYI